MTIYPIVCCGPHAAGQAPTLGAVSVPDGTPNPNHPALCNDCSDTYAVVVGTTIPVGTPPNADDVANILPGRRPANWSPPHPFKRPSWAGPNDKWPFPHPPITPPGLS